jgi:hypothetical protein
MKLASGTILAIAALLMSAGVARAADGVVVLTPSLDFGRAVVGATTTQDIELYNGTSSTLQLNSMRLAGDIVDFVRSFTNGTTCPTPAGGASAGVAPGATCVVAVTYAPSTFGPMSGWLNMDFCAAGVTPCEPITTSDVSLTGKGVHAETLTLDPTPANFASTALGTSSPTQTVAHQRPGEDVDHGAVPRWIGARRLRDRARRVHGDRSGARRLVQLRRLVRAGADRHA